MKFLVYWFSIFLMMHMSVYAEQPLDCNVVLSSTITPKSVKEIFEQMRKAKERSRIHPDLVGALEISKLGPGTKIFLNVSDMKGQRLENLQDTEFRVEGVNSDKDTMILSNKILGAFEIEISKLLGRIFLNPEFATRSPYKEGEYVQLGWPYRNEESRDVEVFNLEKKRVETIKKDILPLMAKYIRALNLEEYELEVTSAFGAQPHRIKVKRNDVFNLNIGTEERLMQTLDPVFSSSSIDFNMGEVVRYRNGQGFLQIGIVVALSETSVLIEKETGTQLKIPREKTYKYWGFSRPESLEGTDFSIYQLYINLARSEILEKVLNAVALLTSHEEFLKSSFFKKMEILLELQEILLPWKESGITLELFGRSDFSEVLCAGEGVCRHKVPFLGEMLLEAGIPIKVYVRMLSEREKRSLGFDYGGHTWLEVQSPDGHWYIIDPSFGVIKTKQAALKKSAQDPNSPDAIWWMYKKRREIELKH